MKEKAYPSTLAINILKKISRRGAEGAELDFGNLASSMNSTLKEFIESFMEEEWFS
jgi:hypothetical protein